MKWAEQSYDSYVQLKSAEEKILERRRDSETAYFTRRGILIEYIRMGEIGREDVLHGETSKEYFGLGEIFGEFV